MIRRKELPKLEIPFIMKYLKEHGVLTWIHIKNDREARELFPYRQRLYCWIDRCPNIKFYQSDSGPRTNIWYLEEEKLQAYLKDQKGKRRVEAKTDDLHDLAKSFLNCVMKEGMKNISGWSRTLKGWTDRDPRFDELLKLTNDLTLTDEWCDKIKHKKNEPIFYKKEVV